MKNTESLSYPWLLCIHNIPPKPPYLRAKAAKRLAALGAVALKSAVYVLPAGDRQHDGLLWLSKEIKEGGGRAFVCAANFDEGAGSMDNARIKAIFLEARAAQYRELAAEAQPKVAALGEPRQATQDQRQEAAAWLAQLRNRFEKIVDIDFFGAPGREVVEGILTGVAQWLLLAAAEEKKPEAEGALRLQARLEDRLEDYQGRTWVTRPGVHVDRIASAWLIRRFIDPEAQFRFDARTASTRDVHFDMAEAEFTHEGEKCTFEVMLCRFGLGADPALSDIGVVIHDIDLNEEQPSRPESPGIAALMAGIALRTDDDEERLRHGFLILDDLLEFFRRARSR
jgi:hypothetical protein